MKILTTALFSVLLLGKKISRTQWVAVGILTLAVALVQVCMYLSVVCVAVCVLHVMFICVCICVSVCRSVFL